MAIAQNTTRNFDLALKHGLSRRRRWLANRFITAALVALTLLLCQTQAHAQFVEIQVDPILLLGGKVDFGTGAHTNGRPSNPATVRWSYSMLDGQTVARANVSGTLYLDDFFGGRVRLVVQYLNFNFGIFHTQTFTSQQMPFAATGAASASHQFTISTFHESHALHTVRITCTFVADDNSTCCGAFGSISVRDRDFRTRITNTNGVAIGLGSFNAIEGTPPFFAGPIQDAVIRFTRENGVITGSVDARTYWNSLTSPATIRAQVEYLDRFGNTIRDPHVFTKSCPGGDPNLTANQIRIAPTIARHTDGRLWRIRVSIGTVNSSGGFIVSGIRLITLEAGVSNGTFEVSPDVATVQPQQRVNYAFTWTVPDPLNWHDLHALQFRIRNGDEVVASIYFDEATQTFALLDERTGRLGQQLSAGSNRRLETPHATIFLRDSSVQAAGPTSPTVTLNISMSFKMLASGKSYSIDVAAHDDESNFGNFDLAGAVNIGP